MRLSKIPFPWTAYGAEAIVPIAFSVIITLSRDARNRKRPGQRIATKTDSQNTFHHFSEIRFIPFLPNVPDDLSLLASGVTPAREAEAGGMTEVPKA